MDLDGSRGLIFEYSFPTEVLIDGRYFIKIHSQYAYLYGHALFITPEPTNGPIDVEFLLQPDWAVAVPFDSLANKVFRVNQVSQLVHNIVHAGPLERRVTTEFDKLTLAYFLFEGRQASQSEMETYIDVTHRMLVELEEIVLSMPAMPFAFR